jgi:hypothetical protein
MLLKEKSEILLKLLFSIVAVLFKNHSALAIENIALRQSSYPYTIIPTKDPKSDYEIDYFGSFYHDIGKIGKMPLSL